MNLRRKLRTDRRLWLAASVLSFVMLGFVSLHNQVVEGKVGPTYFWGVVFHQPRVEDAATAAGIIGIFAAILAAPSAVVGWVAQAVLVAVRTGVVDRQVDRAPPPN